MASIEHDPFRELAAGYVLAALEPDERDAFAAHLIGCRECAREVAELRAVLDVMPETTQPRDPPPQVKDRILAAVHNERSAPRTAVAENRRRRAPSSLAGRLRMPSLARLQPRRLLMGTAAALSVLVVGLSLAVSYQAFQTTRDADARLAESYRALRVMAAADQRWQVGGSDAAPQAAGILAYSARRNEASMVLWGLPIEPDTRYVAWTQNDGTRQPVGTMYEADGGLWLVMKGDVRANQGVGVSLRTGSGATQVVYFDLAQPAATPVQGLTWGDEPPGS
jgi:hypothetical protein